MSSDMTHFFNIFFFQSSNTPYHIFTKMSCFIKKFSYTPHHKQIPKFMSNISYTIQVQARGLKRDIYLMLDNEDRRHLFTITRFETRPSSYSFLLRHVKKEKLGALADVKGLPYLQSIMSAMFDKVTADMWSGTFAFTARLITDDSEFSDRSARYFKALSGYLVDCAFKGLSWNYFYFLNKRYLYR